jgi:hypothetical protein
MRAGTGGRGPGEAGGKALQAHSSGRSGDAALERMDVATLEASLDAQGFAPLPQVLTPDDCAALAALYSDEARFRSRVDMQRLRFGIGEYKYFAAPLPPAVQRLRESLYALLAPIASRWRARLERDDAVKTFPPTLDAFLGQCHRAGQTRPTPLLLSYSAGGYNCLHQDLYGDLAFPLQAVFVLSRRRADYTGGEFLLVEQRPRAQSRGHAIAIEQGDGLVFATRDRPVNGSRGTYRAAMRHGVSTITSGSRVSLGIILHDAR